MALAKAGGKRRRAAKKAAETKLGGKKYVTPLRPIRAVKPPLRKMKGGTNLSARAGQVDPTKRTPKQPTRTAAQRASDKKKFLATQKTLRKESAGMRHGSEYKGPPKLGKKEQDAMARSMELGSGGGLAKVAAAGVGAGALKLYQMYKAKKAADLAKVTAKAKRAATAAKKAAEAKKGISGIGQTRAASAASRTSGLGKAKPKPKPKPKKKKSAAQIKRESMRGGSQWR